MTDIEIRQGGRGRVAAPRQNGLGGKAREDARGLLPDNAVVKMTTRKHADASDLVPTGTVVKVPTRRHVDASDMVPDVDTVRTGGTLDPSPRRQGPLASKAQPVQVRKDAGQATAMPTKRRDAPIEVRRDAAAPQPDSTRQARRDGGKVKVVKPTTAKAIGAPSTGDFEVIGRTRNVRMPEPVDLGSVEIVPPGRRPDGTPHGAEPRPAEVTVKKPKRAKPPRFLKSVMETLEIKTRRHRKADASDMMSKGTPQVTLDTDSVWTPEAMRKSSKRKK